MLLASSSYWLPLADQNVMDLEHFGQVGNRPRPFDGLQGDLGFECGRVPLALSLHDAPGDESELIGSVYGNRSGYRGYPSNGLVPLGDPAGTDFGNRYAPFGHVKSLLLFPGTS